MVVVWMLSQGLLWGGVRCEGARGPREGRRVVVVAVSLALCRRRLVCDLRRVSELLVRDGRAWVGVETAQSSLPFG